MCPKERTRCRTQPRKDGPMARDAITLVKRTARGLQYWDARWYDFAAGRRRAKCLGRCDRYSEHQARKLLARIEVKFDDNPAARSAEKPPTLGEWLVLFIERQTSKGR